MIGDKDAKKICEMVVKIFCGATLSWFVIMYRLSGDDNPEATLGTEVDGTGAT